MIQRDTGIVQPLAGEPVEKFQICGSFQTFKRFATGGRRWELIGLMKAVLIVVLAQQSVPSMSSSGNRQSEVIID